MRSLDRFIVGKQTLKASLSQTAIKDELDLAEENDEQIQAHLCDSGGVHGEERGRERVGGIWGLNLRVDKGRKLR